MGQIFRATLRRNLISLLIFGFGIGFFHWLVVVSFPAIGGLDAVQSVVGTFPPGLRSLLRIAPNLQAGFNLANYLALSWFHPLYLGLGSAFVVQRATDAIAGDIESGAIYLILSRPVSRWSLLLGKALELTVSAGILCLVGCFGLVLGTVFLPSTAVTQALPVARYVLIALMSWLLFASLGSQALVVSACASRKSSAGGIGSIWLIGTFLLDVVPFVAQSAFAWLNPWHHYFPQEVVSSGRVEAASVAVLLGWALLGTAIAGAIFARRDLI